MGKAKGKVDEKSLDSLKKKLKAGGERKKETKKAKTPTPRPRSRSRSRGRPRKATPPPPPKKPAARKPRKSVVKVKRLDDKPSSSSRTPTRTRGGKGGSENSNVYPTAYKLRPRTPASSDHEISSSTKFFEDSTSETGVKEPGVKATVNGTSGWLSKCVIM